jgi:hypothetical protein
MSGAMRKEDMNRSSLADNEDYEKGDSIPFADEDYKAVVEGARSALREPRPLRETRPVSRLVDQGTQTEVEAAAAAAEDKKQNGKEGGGAKCAVQ